MKWIKWILTAAAGLLAMIAGLLFFVQGSWAKDKISTLLEEIALQQGLQLKIEKIEGELPLKWTLSNVHLQLNENDAIDIDRLRLRISILPLLRKQIGISYLSIDHLTYRFMPAEKQTSREFPAFPQAFSIRTFKLKEFRAINLKTSDEALYSLSGSCHFKNRIFDLYAQAQSPDLDLNAFIQGDKKNRQIAADLKLHVKSERAFAPFTVMPYATAFRLETQCAGPWKTWTSLIYSSEASAPLSGTVKLDVQRLALPELKGLDENLEATARFSLFPNRALSVYSMILKSELLCIKGNAEFDRRYFPQSIDCSFLFPHLSRLAPHLDGIVKGEIDYNGQSCQIVLQSESLGVRQATFKNAELILKAHETDGLWKGTLQTSALHPELEFKGSSALTFRSGRLDLQGFSLLSPHASVVGDFGFDLPAFTNLSGGLSFQISDLSTGTQLSPIPIAGQIGGQIDLQGDDIRCHAIAKVLKAGPFLSQQVVLDLFAADIFHELKGKLSLEANNSYLADVYLSSASYSMGWNTRDWDYSLQAQGDWKHPFNISTAGHFAFSPRSFEIVCNSFAGSLLQKNLTLEQPLTFKLRTNEAQLADLRFKIDGGFIHSDFHIAPDVSKISVQAEHFPLDFLTLLSPRLSLQGLSSIDVDLAGTPSDLSGHCNILLEQADILPAGAKAPIQTKASLQANLQHDIFQFHTHIVATGEQLVEASGTLPIAYQLYPFQASLKPSKPLSGQCTIEGHVEQLFDFINIGSQRFGGFLSCHFVLSGTAEKPSLSGPLSVQGGFYQNYFIGMQLKNGNVEASANGSTIAVSSAQISDVGDGSASATAVFKLEPALPFKIEGTVSHFRPIEFDWLRASCSGPFTITGDLHKALAEGTLAIDDAEVQIPERLPGTIPTLPVTYVNQPPSFTPPKPAKVPYPFHYDLQINGKENIHLTGHGIDADLAGDIHMTGKNLKVTALGTLKTNKGKISFAGKDFQITDGEITFSENEGFINLTSKLDLPDLAVTVIFRGSFNSPQLIFESHPSLPTSSILARILFNKDVSELNASQAGQLAYTIFKLSGASGPNILETIHKNLGIDQLNFSVNEETGDVSIQVGKYLMQGVMITLTQSAEQSHVLVTVELKGGFVLQAETHFDDQGKYSFKWNKNY